MLLATPSHLNTSLSGSPTTPVSSAITRIRNFEGRGRQHRLSGAILVAGDDDIFLGLVADEGADRSCIGKVLGQVLANLAARGRDIGKTARGQNARASKKSERMAAIDHGNFRYDLKAAATMLMTSW